MVPALFKLTKLEQAGEVVLDALRPTDNNKRSNPSPTLALFWVYLAFVFLKV